MVSWKGNGKKIKYREREVVFNKKSNSVESREWGPFIFVP